MLITDDKKLKDIQREFGVKFPNLKLEFYGEHHEKGEGSPTKQMLNPELTIKEARTKHIDGELSIDGHQKVSTLEQKFYDIYGLNVQVFRWSKGIWLQTISTDDWTLAEQNRKGQQ